ncbi:MAG TPA: hypothetical protein VN832_02615 [Stellaceae bacterium]|nr:hypothetical protein [Stellaceae bacterium]
MVWIVATSEAFQKCVHERKNDRGYSALHESPSVVARAVVRWRDLNRACVGDFTDKNQGAILALATAVIAWFTISLAQATRLIHRHSEVSERAYVKISHCPPGLTIDAENGTVKVVFRIENSGRTPADVTNVCLYLRVVPAGSKIPPYASPQDPPVPAFLVVGDKIFYHREFGISGPEINHVFGATARLFVYGYVDYTDVFGQAHRGGYGRIYDPVSEDLGFTTEGRLNYDRNI